jgi:hypothetical protein
MKITITMDDIQLRIDSNEDPENVKIESIDTVFVAIVPLKELFMAVGHISHLMEQLDE